MERLFHETILLDSLKCYGCCRWYGFLVQDNTKQLAVGQKNCS